MGRKAKGYGAYRNRLQKIYPGGANNRSKHQGKKEEWDQGSTGDACPGAKKGKPDQGKKIKTIKCKKEKVREIQ